MKLKFYFVGLLFFILLAFTTNGQDENNNIMDLMQAGRDAFNKSLYDEAMSYFDQIIKKDPTIAEAWYRKGLAAADPRTFDAFEPAQDNEGALKYFNKAIEIDPSYEEALAMRGLKLAFLDRFDEALESIDKALEINSTSDLAWNAKGICLYRMGDLEGSIPCYEKAIKNDPNWGDPYYNIGVSLEEIGREEEGDKYTRKAEGLQLRAF